MRASGQAALLALATYSELKNIILVDEDVDIFDSDDILWAMTTRMQGDVSITTIPGIRGHQLDPSQTPEYSPSIRGKGISCKTIFDCTVPWDLKSHFERAPFAEVDPRPFAPEYFARLEKTRAAQNKAIAAGKRRHLTAQRHRRQMAETGLVDASARSF